MNENLTWELKAVHYKFTQFLEGVDMRSGMGKAFVKLERFFVGTQMENPEILAGVNAVTQTKGAGGGCAVPQ